jgi:hypothetical protein
VFIPHYRIVIFLQLVSERVLFSALVFLLLLCLSLFLAEIFLKNRDTFWSVKWVFGPTLVFIIIFEVVNSFAFTSKLMELELFISWLYRNYSSD